MKKPLLFTVCFVLAFSTLRAQEPDPMMQEITTSVSIPVQISNGRQMFLKELLAGDERKAGEVRDYLRSRVQDTPYLAFTYMEQLLSMYWTRDYGGVLANTALADSLFSMQRDMKIPPTYDELAMKLLRMSTDSLAMLEERNSRLRAVDGLRRVLSKPVYGYGISFGGIGIGQGYRVQRP
jgi:hypothetical protein